MAGPPPSVRPQRQAAKIRSNRCKPPTPAPHRAGRGASGVQSSPTSSHTPGPCSGRAGPALS
eukprot:5551039-Lingulodinium_polyedra.AAC.1